MVWYLSSALRAINMTIPPSIKTWLTVLAFPLKILLFLPNSQQIAFVSRPTGIFVPSQANSQLWMLSKLLQETSISNWIDQENGARSGPNSCSGNINDWEIHPQPHTTLYWCPYSFYVASPGKIPFLAGSRMKIFSPARAFVLQMNFHGFRNLEPAKKFSR